jgi:hypothetical protein
MPVNVELNGLNSKTLKFEGLTSGNGVIVRVPELCRDMAVSYIPTSAGTGSVKVSVDGETPTDFTDFSKTSLGDVTATSAQEIQSGVRWVGFDPASGTWTFNVSFRF